MINEHVIREPLPYGKPSKSLDLIGFIKRYGLFILVIGSFLFTISVPIVLLISKPNYEVKAIMRVEPVMPSLITSSEDPQIINYYQDYARTQAQRMMSFDVLKKTVGKLTPDEKSSIFPKGMPIDNCATMLSYIIKTNPISGTHLIEITASSLKKEGLAPLVNNFMAVFLEKVRKNAEMQDNERLVFLRNKKNELTTDISTIENKLIILTKNINTATFSEGYNLAGKKNEELQRLYIRSLVEQIAAKTQLDEKVKINNQIKNLSLEPMVDEMVMKDVSLSSTSSWTYQQQQQMRSSTDGLTKNNPDRIYIEERMKAMHEYEKKQRNELNKNAHKIIYGIRDFGLNKDLITATSDFERTKTAEEKVKVELTKSNAEAIKTSVGLHLGESLEAELKHKRELLDHIDTRIQELEVEGKAPLHLSIESAARKPDHAEGSNINKLFMIFFSVSFGAVGGVFFAYDYFDNRIRRSKDIQQALGYSPACIVPLSTDNIPFHQLIFSAADNDASKAIKSFAVKLTLEKAESNAAIILFTGVDKSAGCTSITLNSAQALSTLAPKVLLIEGNIAEPALSKITGLSLEPKGLSDFLNSTDPWKNFVVSNPTHNISVMYAGHTIIGNTFQHRIKDLIDSARKEYDYICIDCAPVLQSDLTEHLALYADIIVLISVCESTIFNDLRKAAELLVHLKVPAIAPLINWGGLKRSMSIDKLLEKQPEILDKINTKKIEEIIQNLPAAKELISKIKTIINSTLNKKKISQEEENHK